MEESETWNFAVVGCDSNDFPHYLGFFNAYEDAVEFGENMRKIGWSRVAVFDAFLEEVKENPDRG